MKRENLAQWTTVTKRETWALIFTSPLTETLSHSLGFSSLQFWLLEYTNYLALKVSSTMKYFITVVRQWVKSLQMGELDDCVPIKANFSHATPSL